MHKLRHAMARPGREQLSGIIEVDETYIGEGKPGKRGRGTAGNVLVVLEVQVDGNRIGRIRLQRVSDASGKSLEEAVQGAVASARIVRMDGWKGYNRLYLMGHLHEKVREEANVGKNLLPKCNILV